MHRYYYVGHNPVYVFLGLLGVYGVSATDGNEEHVDGQKRFDELGRAFFAYVAEVAHLYAVHTEFENYVLAPLFAAVVVVKAAYRVYLYARHVVAALFIYDHRRAAYLFDGVVVVVMVRYRNRVGSHFGHSAA